MEESTIDDVWEEISDLVESGQLEKIEALVVGLEPCDRRRCLSRLSQKQQTELMSMLPSEVAASLLEPLPENQAAEMLETLSSEVAGDIVKELPIEKSADLLHQMDGEDCEELLKKVEISDDTSILRDLVSYPVDTAGGLMSNVVISVPEEATVSDVVETLGDFAEKNEESTVHYVYVVDKTNHLIGLVSLTNLLLKKKNTKVSEFMIKDPARTVATEPLDDLNHRFDDEGYISLPVVDEHDYLLGVVTRKRVREAASKQQNEDYLHASGIVGGEELRGMPMGVRARRRLAWLAPNIILNLAAASIIAVYQDTLQAVIALAVFLPIISDMSGCSGNQAVAVSIRELTLGLIRPTEFLRIVWKEGVLGIINGSILGLLLGTIAFVWKGNIWLGLVVGGSLMLNTILSVTLGGMVPLLLKKLKADPALASGPILTTCTDMCGFFLVLNLASAVLTKLT